MNTRIPRVATLLAALVLAACAQTPQTYAEKASAQAAANAKPGARSSPAQVSPAPVNEVSPQMQALIAGPYPGHFNAAPKDAAEWKALINSRAAPVIAAIPA